MSSSTEAKISMAKTVISTIGSVAAAAMVVRSVARDYLPPEFQDYLFYSFRTFINKFSTHLTMVIYEFDGFRDNEIYNATQLYLASRISHDVHRLKITKNPSEKNINVAMEINEEFTDVYNGVKFTWSLVSKKTPTREYYNNEDMSGSTRTDLRFLELSFHRKHKDLALNEYLPFIINDAKTRKEQEKTLKLFTIDTKMVYSGYPTVWTPVNLDHPANFSTLAMDTDIKEKVMKDLDRFIQRREYYRKVGKAWKRGYLLYGPPGTGKSSLIAAMANYLNFDIYDLELTDIKSNSELRRLLVATANRSILVVEDIDCSVELHDRVGAGAAKALARQNQRRGYQEERKVTLSGFLNFIDGLWSSCGDERIIIFTTNKKDKLDHALLRPGRMDVHINMSYCTQCGFRLLASNYLGITEHHLFEKIEDLICKVEITPAEVAEQLLKDDDPDIALEGLIEFFDIKNNENEEAKAKAKEEELAKTKENEDTESSENEETKAKTIVSTIGSVSAAVMVVRSVARDYLPPEIRDYLFHGFRSFINQFFSQITMVIYEFDGFRENEIYNATHVYLAARFSVEIHRLKITKTASEKKINVAMEINEEFTDEYHEVKFKWSLVSKKTPTGTAHYHNNVDRSGSYRTNLRFLELTFHRKHKDLALNEYLPFIINDAKTRTQQEKTLKIFTVDAKGYSNYPTLWTPVNLDHPATFSTLAMETDVKEKVMKDLDRFIQRKEFYRKVGKAWKRGYLLYGPPGTGKSSLIAAMANYLNFDIYDLELTDVKSNADLRRLLVATANRSILVVEDIDCSVELHNRAVAQAAKLSALTNQWRGSYPSEDRKVTLSGFLNFIDGLWSSCGDERIIIFTTNRKDKLDPALLRPGRMDVHINMSYCTPCGLRLLASNYHGITEHHLFEEIEDLIREVEITPAEVAEQLLKDDDPDIALIGLIDFFDVKRKENEEAKAKEEEKLAKAKAKEEKVEEEELAKAKETRKKK
ncbi:hypothetical protein LXL04_013772 [Taraxacum kok-saghyz]